MEVYARTRTKNKENADVKVPILTVLVGNVSYKGVIHEIDFNKNKFTLGSYERNENALTFIDWNSISVITFHNLDLCKEFVEDLAAQPGR